MPEFLALVQFPAPIFNQTVGIATTHVSLVCAPSLGSCRAFGDATTRCWTSDSFCILRSGGWIVISPTPVSRGARIFRLIFRRFIWVAKEGNITQLDLTLNIPHHSEQEEAMPNKHICFHVWRLHLIWLSNILRGTSRCGVERFFI